MTAVNIQQIQNAQSDKKRELMALLLPHDLEQLHGLLRTFGARVMLRVLPPMSSVQWLLQAGNDHYTKLDAMPNRAHLVFLALLRVEVQSICLKEQPISGGVRNIEHLVAQLLCDLSRHQLAKREL